MDLGGGVEFRHSNGEFPRPRNGLNNDVRFFDSGREELGLGAGEEGFNYCSVPASMDDADAEIAAVVLLSFSGSFE